MFLISILIIYPKYLEINKLNRDIFKLREGLEIKYEQAKRLRKSQISLAASKKISEKLDGRILKKGDEVKLISFLENAAEKIGLKQEIHLAPGYKKINEDLSTIDLNIEAAGTYLKLLGYLNTLEKNTYYLEIPEITITKAPTLDAKKPADLLVLTLKVTAYVQN